MEMILVLSFPTILGIVSEMKHPRSRKQRIVDNVSEHNCRFSLSPVFCLLEIFKWKSALTSEKSQSVILFFSLLSLLKIKKKKRFLSFRSFIPGCIHEDTPHSAFDALMNHEYLHIILTNVFRYDLHQSVNQMIRWSENVFVLFSFFYLLL